MGDIAPIIDGIRRQLQFWLITNEPLLATASAGATQISLRSARRFKKGDEFLIRNAAGKIENNIIVDEIIDNTTLSITSPLQFTWPLSAQCSVVRTFDGNFVRAIHFGEPSIINMNEMPAITVNATTSESEWLTVRSTKEKYNIEISGFVANSTDEAGRRQLIKIMNHISKCLKSNLYPLPQDFELTTLTSNVYTGDFLFKVPSSVISSFQQYNKILLENKHYTQEFLIKCITDSETIEVVPPAGFDFSVSETSVIIPHRFIYNSWPSNINYGKISKGNALLYAGVLNFFCEELEDQLQTSWNDTQLK